MVTQVTPRMLLCTGNNPTNVCNKCAGDRVDIRCTCNDPFGGFAGAFECMASGVGDVAFVRNTSIEEYVKKPNVTMTEAVSSSHKSRSFTTSY